MADTRPMAFVTRPGKIEFREKPVPELGPGDVLVTVKAVTLCGSDLHVFRGAHPSVSLPVPIGHEIAGEVEKVGADVQKVKPGDRVALEPVIVCDACEYCCRGEYHLCSNINFQYRVGQGGITTVFVAQERWAHKLPDKLTYFEGVLLEPLAVAIQAVRHSESGLGDSIAIFGAGAIGLLILMVSKLAGAGKVFISDVREPRLEVARKLGAYKVTNALEEDVVEKIMGETSDLGAYCGFEAAGLAITVENMIDSLQKGGRGVLVGIFESEHIQIDANKLIQKSITLVGSQGYHWDFQRALNLCETESPDLSSLITHKFPFEDVQAAFELLEDPNSSAIKVVLVP
jgi:2-desacetyl-2-hydroxyethyl bacteriochlorophyllide A dehydrogenase